MAAGQAEFWKQRINLEKRGEDFTHYWAATQPKMFSPSSLNYIDAKAHSHTDHAVLQQQAEAFKQVKSPNKYMRLNHNLDRQQVGLVQSPVSSPTNLQMQAPRTQPLPYRQLEFQTPTQRPRRMAPMSQSHNQLDLIMPSTSKPTSAFEYSQQLKKKKEFTRSYMSSPGNSPSHRNQRLPSLQHPQITTATQLRPAPPARCEKPSAFYETMLRNKVYL